jgi:hypothetical protein
MDALFRQGGASAAEPRCALVESNRKFESLCSHPWARSCGRCSAKGQVKAERGVFFDEKGASVNNYFKAGGVYVIL